MKCKNTTKFNREERASYELATATAAAAAAVAASTPLPPNTNTESIALGAARVAGAQVGLEMHEVKSGGVDTRALIEERKAERVLGGHIGHPDAV